MNQGALLAVEHLTMRFGGLVAVDDVSFSAHDRQITGVIGYLRAPFCGMASASSGSPR